MKTLPPALQARLSGGVTTLCHCWRVTRHDGTVMGFTEHDRDVVAVGTTFQAGTGFTASRMEQSLGLSIDNVEAAGALSTAGISEADILAGRYDDAAVDLLLVDWADPTVFVALTSGNLGEIRREGLAFSAELRSLAHRLNQKIGSTYSRQCGAALGDARCKVDLSQAQYRAAFTVAAGGAGRVLVAAGLSSFASDWFTGGTVTFLTGADAGLVFEVKAHRRTSGIDELELWLPPPFPIADGDAGTVVAGSLAFNIGAGGFAGSTVVHKLNAGDAAGAADAFLMWERPPELRQRRNGERAQFLAPDSPAPAPPPPPVLGPHLLPPPAPGFWARLAAIFSRKAAR